MIAISDYLLSWTINHTNSHLAIFSHHFGSSAPVSMPAMKARTTCNNTKAPIEMIITSSMFEGLINWNTVGVIKGALRKTCKRQGSICWVKTKKKERKKINRLVIKMMMRMIAVMTIACVAEAWKWRAQERTGSAWETREEWGSACPRGPWKSFLLAFWECGKFLFVKWLPTR